MSSPDATRSSLPSILDQIYAGSALFFSMYYILSVNPAILARAGVPVALASFGTIVTIVVGNLTGIALTRTGLMIAPALGMSGFVVSFVLGVHSPGVFSWQSAMGCCAIAGLAVFLTSVFSPDLRSRVIKDLPTPVRKGAGAAIGAILIKQAFDMFPDTAHLNFTSGVILVVLGTGTIIGFFLLRTKFQEKATPIVNLLLRCEFIIVVVLTVIALDLFDPEYIGSLPNKNSISIADIKANYWVHMHSGPITGDTALHGLIFCFMIYFLVIADIPGTPSEVLPDSIKEEHKGRAVKLGYLNDAFWALLSPFLGTTPTIYYAENNILRGFNAYSWPVGLVAIIWFIVAVSVSLVFHYSFQQIIPPVATIPIVMFIGLIIISGSFGNRSSDAGDPVGSLEYYLPTAISVILTPRIGVECAFPLSVLSYWLVAGKNDRRGSTFVWISVGAAFSLVVQFIVLVLPPG